MLTSLTDPCTGDDPASSSPVKKCSTSLRATSMANDCCKLALASFCRCIQIGTTALKISARTKKALNISTRKKPLALRAALYASAGNLKGKSFSMALIALFIVKENLPSLTDMSPAVQHQCIVDQICFQRHSLRKRT